MLPRTRELRPDFRLTHSPNEGERYRRSSSLLLHWAASGPQCFHVGSTQPTPVTRDVVALLNMLTSWSAVREIVTWYPELGSIRDTRRLLRKLADLGLVERSGATA